MSFKAYMMEIIQQLVRVYYQFDSNSANELKAPQKGWVFLNPNPHEVYNQTI